MSLQHQILIIICYGVLFLSWVFGSLSENSVSFSPVERDSRIFRIRIPAWNCSSVITGYAEGYCDGIASCISDGGLIAGICPIPIAICCVTKRSCGGTIRQRIAYFRNRKYPTATEATGTCSVTVVKYQTDAVQIRIDFLDFELQGPNSDGVCNTESLVVTGYDSRFLVPTICGSNTGQHMYVNFAATGNIVLTVTLLGGLGQSSFNLKITQYRSNNQAKAPDGCLQYFPLPAGTVESFNYAGSQHLASQTYLICVQKVASSTECVTWTFNDLRISSSTANGQMCSSSTTLGDYIIIPGGTLISTNEMVNTYCLSSTTGQSVRTTSFKIEVVLNGAETGDAANARVGFQMSYVVGACI